MPSRAVPYEIDSGLCGTLGGGKQKVRIVHLCSDFVITILAKDIVLIYIYTQDTIQIRENKCIYKKQSFFGDMNNFLLRRIPVPWVDFITKNKSI